MQVYKAHINETTKAIQTVKEHNENTARLCSQFAIPELKELTYMVGLLHDVGKYQRSFQKRIDGAKVHVEHSTCGAMVAKEKYPKSVALMMEYCIVGHHSGLPDGGFCNDTGDLSTLHGRLSRKFEDYSIYKEELELKDIDFESFVRFLMQDCGKNFKLFVDKYAFLTRYCFSCLVDADSLDTAAFCGDGSVKQAMSADFAACLKLVEDKLNSFVCETELQRARAYLQKQVFQKIKHDAEIYLMNMPTGSGKTLASVKFALERAIKTGKKRIIYVIPYNSIIDQTYEVFHNLFGEHADILRHQSTFSYEEEDRDEDYREMAKRATENWDAEFLITTMVQFFESIYANKRGKLRKLHNMADSILIFDEAHLMPQEYLQPCLQAVTFITKYLNSEAVFLTATMPDFSKLIQQYALPNSKIENLVEDTFAFCEFQKCKYSFMGETDTKELLKEAAKYPSSLIIVNKKRTARKLYQECQGHKFHLSTYMTGYDRKRVIDEIKTALHALECDFPGYVGIPENRKITIVSTSLIEAGVDLDVYTVFRELSGLDSILQAGGRCNREGKRKEASTFIFELTEEKNRVKEEEKYNITKGLLARHLDISSQDSIKEYYDRIFFIKKEELQKNAISQLCSDIASIPFHEYAETFEIIDSQTISVVVPRDEKSREIVQVLRYMGSGAGRRLQNYTCSIHQNELNDLIKQNVIDDFGTGIFCLTNPDYYDENTGILFEGKDYII